MKYQPLRRTPYLLVAVMLVGSTLGISGQEPAANRNGCSVLKPDRPPLYISLEGAIDLKAGNRSEGVLLRLHNNTTCGVVIETSDIMPSSDEYKALFKSRVLKDADGRTLVQYAFDPPPQGARLPVFYDVQDPKWSKAPRPANYWAGRDIVVTWTLPPDRAVVFPVKKEHFKRRYGISVPFTYEWEPGPGLSQSDHRVYYLHDFPKGFYEGAKRQ